MEEIGTTSATHAELVQLSTSNRVTWACCLICVVIPRDAEVEKHLKATFEVLQNDEEGEFCIIKV